ncbi:hypothetical protein ABKV19_005156 [Rosa sericea]
MFHHVLIFRLFLLLLVPSATPSSFQFSNFSIDDYSTDLYVEGDAFIDPPFLRLTKSTLEQVRVGRATYNKPFLLQNKATGELADFSSSFCFSINSQNNSNYSNGLAFFISPNGSLLNVPLGGGASLGLPFNISTASYQYPFVAVEFDFTRNLDDSIKDPSESTFSTIDGHVGIDVNSLESSVTAPWNGGIMEGRLNTVTVSYDSSTKNLTVDFTNSLKTYSISHAVDLTLYFPDGVIVGFSASMGDSITLHNIISWNFTSSLDESLVNRLNMTPPDPATSPMASSIPDSRTDDTENPPSDAKPRNNDKIKLGVGLSVGGVIIMFVVSWVAAVKFNICHAEKNNISIYCNWCFKK